MRRWSVTRCLSSKLQELHKCPYFPLCSFSAIKLNTFTEEPILAFCAVCVHEEPVDLLSVIGDFVGNYNNEKCLVC